MITVPNSKDLCDFNLGDYMVPTYKETRGYMYVVFDSIFPDYIKVGRTIDCKKRLQGYNSDKPYPTAKMLYVSKLFDNVNDVERKILEYLYDNTSPTTLSKEWFQFEHKQLIIDILEKAEQEF